MSFFPYPLLKPLFFKLDPERSHDMSLNALSAIQRCPKLLAMFRKSCGVQEGLNASGLGVSPNAGEVEVMGLRFPNRVGLAAGYDKNGICVPAIAAMGFGFIEVGTVTPKPQMGNPKPRIFRIEEENAVINRLGFNNHGVDALVSTLNQSQSARASTGTVLGINIGKNKDTPNEEAHLDYLSCMSKVYGLADYIVVNISSPNTPGLRLLQEDSALRTLLQPLKEKQLELYQSTGKKVPLVVKIAPDNTDKDIAIIAQVCLELEIDGIIATNTTLNHDSVKAYPQGNEVGGLSGKPLMAQSTHVVSVLSRLLQHKIPIIAVGGILSAEDALAKIQAGASLVQIYTGLIYKGPKLIEEVVRTLSKI